MGATHCSALLSALSGAATHNLQSTALSPQPTNSFDAVFAAAAAAVVVVLLVAVVAVVLATVAAVAVWPDAEI